MELLRALEAEKLTKEKRKEFCGTPCTIVPSKVTLYCDNIIIISYIVTILSSDRSQYCDNIVIIM